MIYKVKIKEISLCGCGNEGNMLIEFGNNSLMVYYQAPDAFIKEYIIQKTNNIKKNPLEFILSDDKALFPIDLWLVYRECRKLNSIEKEFPKNLNVSGGTIKGEIVSLSTENEIRIDCGIIIDIDNESNTPNLLSKGDYVEVAGTYQVYFPRTEYCR